MRQARHKPSATTAQHCCVIQMSSLRKMTTLRVLNLMHNPVTTETDYRLYAIAYCPQLAYVDFEAVEDSERQAIKDSAMAVDEIRELDERLLAAREAEELRQANAARLARLNVSSKLAIHPRSVPRGGFVHRMQTALQQGC